MTPEEAMKDAAKGHPNNLLEALRRALGTLKDPKCPFRFDDWGVCTCGHIYAASTKRGELTPCGSSPVGAIVRPGPRTMYHRMLNAIIEANDLHDEDTLPAPAVSNATDNLARKRARRPGEPGQRSLRNAAITLLEKTVAHVEQQERDAMLRVAR